MDLLNPDVGMNVDPSLAYEFSFMVRAQNNTPFTVRMYGLDESGTANQLRRLDTPIMPIGSLASFQTTLPRDDIYYFYRVIVHPEGTVFTGNGHHDRGSFTENSNNFTMLPGICRIVPEVTLDNGTGGGVGRVWLYDIRFGLSRTPYSTGYLGLDSYVQIFGNNNAAQYTQRQLEEIISTYLIPYESTLQLNLL